MVQVNFLNVTHENAIGLLDKSSSEVANVDGSKAGPIAVHTLINLTSKPKRPITHS